MRNGTSDVEAQLALVRRPNKHNRIVHFHAEGDQHLGGLVPDSAGELLARGTTGQSKHSDEGMTP